jgi:hypothetical protein
MTHANLPWKYSHIKKLVSYRKWQALKHFRDHEKKEQLLKANECGKKILFIHIPKTAGVSLIKTYEGFFADARHSPAFLYKLMLGNDYKRFSTFSIVRAPWARTFSAYIFLMKGGLSEPDPQMGAILKKECPTFERFIKEWLPQKGAYCYQHFVPQHEFVCGWRNNVIVDHILKLEKLSDEWPVLASKLGLPSQEIKKSNVSSEKNYREFYDNESIDIVHGLYSNDIKLFHYSYE